MYNIIANTLSILTYYTKQNNIISLHIVFVAGEQMRLRCHNRNAKMNLKLQILNGFGNSYILSLGHKTFEFIAFKLNVVKATWP